MNGYMNIRIQVLANQARKAIQDVDRDLSKLSVKQGAAAAASGRGNTATRSHMKSLTSFGNQLQWTGRQLQYNWTLPILAAAAAGVHFQMENEKAMTRLKKVYADPGFAHTTAELKALEGAFETLSETYGVAQADVINIAADWAAAGSSGLALAKQTELTMKTMVLGEMEAAEATQALIAIQAQYNQSSEELADTIARLNNVENQTGTKLSDLVVSMSRAAGVARAAGIDVSHLAAMTAALVPAAGTASQAGNALKTIISRLLSPTGEASDILNEMGINLDDMAWKGANATSRIELLARKFSGLSDSQQAVVSATLASRYQINKFEVLMGAIAQKGNAAGEGMSYYWKALEAATNRTQYLDQVTRELDAVLDSNPRKWEKIKAVMSNAMANVVQPMLPALMAIGGQIATLTDKLSELDPVTLKWIGAFALVLVVLPMATRYFGSLITLAATFGTVLGFMLKPLGLLFAGLRMLGITSLLASLFSLLGVAVMGAGAAFGAVAIGLASLASYLTLMPALLGLASAALASFAGVAVLGPSVIVTAWGAMTGAIATMWGAVLTRMTIAWRAFAITAGFIATQMTWAIRLAWTFMFISMRHIAGIFTVSFAAMWSTIMASISVGLTGPFSIMLAAAAGFGSAFPAILRHIRLTWSMFMASMWFLGRGLWPSMWAAMAAVSVAGGSTLATIMSAVGGGLTAIWAGVTGMIATIWATLGPALARIWVMVSVSLSVVMAQTSAGLVIIWRNLMLAFEALLLGFATAAGIIWRTIPLIMAAGIRGPWAFILGLTANFMVAMAGVFRAGWVAIQAIIVAGAAAAGIIWHTAMVGMALATIAGGAALNAAWLAITRMWALRTAAITAITMLWGSVIVPVMALLGRAIMAALMSPWTYVAVAVVAVLYGLRDHIAVAWKATISWLVSASDAVVDRVVSAFNLLPQGIQNALRAVVNVIRNAAMQVYEWFSYLNPFARHSPSLVENVTNGMAVINSQFGTLTQVARPVNAAYAAIARLKNAMGAMGAELEFAKDRKLIEEVTPGALASFDALVRTLAGVRVQADAMQASVKRQEGVVKLWQQRLDGANKELERQRDILDSLEAVADGYSNEIARLNQNIDDLASTPIAGMGRMEDAIFANEMAQKRLRLEMLKMGDQGGQSIDDIRNKIANMAGEMETLTGERERLRGMGAGSEILGFYDAQINALGKQRTALEKAGAPVDKLQKELDNLQRQAEILDLEKALKFDPLTRAIDKAANAVKELSFDQIINGIRGNQSAIAQITPAYERATAAVEAQKEAVKRAEAAVDSIQASYDAEAEKLAVLRDLYQEVADAVRDMEGALNDASGAASAVKEAKEAEGYVSPALQNFRDAAGGDFADVSGSGMLGREGGMGDQSALIDDWANTLAQTAGDMFGDFDMWQPLKDMWKSFVKWWNKNVMPWINAAGDFFGNLFEGVDVFSGLRGKGDEVGGFFTDIWDAIVAVVKSVWKLGGLLWDLLGEDIQKTLDLIWGLFTDLWDGMKVLWKDMGDGMGPFKEALQNVWKIAKPIAAFFAGTFFMAIQTVWSVFNGVLGPVLEWISGLFGNVYQAVKGLINMFVGLFTLDFSKFFGGLGDVLKGLWGLIWDTIVSLGDAIIGAIVGLADSIWDNMKWLGEMIPDGLMQGIEDAWDGIYGFFDGLVTGVINWVRDLFGIRSPSTVFATIGGYLVDGLVEGIKGAWNTLMFTFTELPGKILGWIGDASLWLLDIGTDIVGGLLKGLISGIAELAVWFWEIKFKVLGWIGDALGWLFDKGVDVIQGFLNGMGWVLGKVWDFFVMLPVNILTWIGDLVPTLFQKGKDLVQGIINGASEKGEALGRWIGELPGKAITWAGDTGKTLPGKGKDLIQGLIDGAKEKALSLKTWIEELPGKVKTWVGDTLTWLFEDGKDTVTGFIDGLKDKRKDIEQWFKELPGKIQEWIGNTGTYLKDNGVDLLKGFIKGIKEHGPQVALAMAAVIGIILLAMVGIPLLLVATGIALITGFVRGIGEAIWSSLGPKLEELKRFLTQKFTDIKDSIVRKWNEVWTDVGNIAQRGIDWVMEKFNWLKDKAIGIFVTIKDWIGMVWNGLLEKFRTPIKVVFDFVNGNMIKPVNELLGKFPGGLHINDLPHLARGGLLRGPGTGTSDSILGIDPKKKVATAAVSNGEFVVNQKSTQANLGLLRALNNARGRLPGYEGGGIIGGALGGLKDAGGWVVDKASAGAQWVGEKIGDLVAKGGRWAAEKVLGPLVNMAKGLIPGDNVASHVMKGTIDKLYDSIRGKGDELDGQNANLDGGYFGGHSRSPNGIGGLGPMAQLARQFVMSTFGITNIGGYANRNIAGTSTKSDHALGKAIDVMIANYKSPAGIAQGNAVASHFVRNPQQFGTKYVIWRDQINEGRGWAAYGHPGGGRSDTLQHRDHVHVSFYDDGGIANGTGMMLKKTIMPERVLSPRQTIAFERLVGSLDGGGIPSAAALEAAIFRATVRANASSTIGEQTVIHHQGDNNLTVHIHGDLSFPNITDGDDADVLLRNLSDLAGGSRHS